jgi:hypothetical protein
MKRKDIVKESNTINMVNLVNNTSDNILFVNKNKIRLEES